MDERFDRGMMKPAYHPERFKDIRSSKLKDGDRVFVGSSGDMFGKWVSSAHIHAVLDNVIKRPGVIFQFLTKNPKRYYDFNFPKNCWLGMTMESVDDKCVKRRIDFDMQTSLKKNITFISFEPLLGVIPEPSVMNVDWIIIGANSNPGADAPPVEWGEFLITSARKHKVPVFVKDNYKGLKKYKEFPKCR